MSRRSRDSSNSTSNSNNKRPISVLTNWAKQHGLSKEAIVEQVVSLAVDTDTTTMVLKALQDIRTEHNRRSKMPAPPPKQTHSTIELETLQKKHIQELLRLQSQREEEQLQQSKLREELEKQREKLLQLESCVKTSVQNERVREPFGIWQPPASEQQRPMYNSQNCSLGTDAWIQNQQRADQCPTQPDRLSAKSPSIVLPALKTTLPELNKSQQCADQWSDTRSARSPNCIHQPLKTTLSLNNCQQIPNEPPELPDFEEILTRVEKYQKPKLDSLKRELKEKEEEEKRLASERAIAESEKQKLRLQLAKNLKIVDEKIKMEEDKKLLENFAEHEIKKTREEKLEQIAKHEVYLSTRASLAAKAEMLAEVEPFRMPSSKTIVSAINTQ